MEQSTHTITTLQSGLHLWDAYGFLILKATELQILYHNNSETNIIVVA